ncbi:uncharacterized protein LOC119646365 [Hermetia illucens]|uniref:uncharacterized protein LOC119646365 n=1 Tax=Hermetia illucens TaxID=343691 RepID=UPI0018CC4A32|nr:uncharacterized protein LOC119646365 [Hermetia illucens]
MQLHRTIYGLLIIAATWTIEALNIRKLDFPGVYFKHMGETHFINSEVSLIRTLDITEIEMEIANIRQLVLSINNLCIEELKQCKTLKLNSELHIRRLNNNLNSVYGLLGISPNIRLKRGLVNLVGSGLKFLFGTMDATDSEKMKAV